MPTWEEWNEQLTEEQRKYSLYKILQSLEQRSIQQCASCATRLDGCDKRFKKLERRKWFDRGVAIVTGVISGIATALGIKL